MSVSLDVDPEWCEVVVPSKGRMHDPPLVPFDPVLVYEMLCQRCSQGAAGDGELELVPLCYGLVLCVDDKLCEPLGDLVARREGVEDRRSRTVSLITRSDGLLRAGRRVLCVRVARMG